VNRKGFPIEAVGEPWIGESPLRVIPTGVGRVRYSGFSRGRLSGVAACAQNRLRSRRVRCPDSLCHSWHTKNKSGEGFRIYRVQSCALIQHV